MNNKSLKILRIVQSTYPEVMGGVGLHVHGMSKLQAEMGHDVTVVTTDNGNHSQPNREERDGYTICRHLEIARPFDNSITPGVLRSLRKYSTEADVVHVHSHLYFMSNLSALYGVFSDTPIILTNHGLVSQTAPIPIQKLFIPTIGRFTFEAADHILCYTDTDKMRLRERGIKTSISVIHNGIDCTRFRPNKNNRRNQILFVGRLKPGKGVDNLIASFGEIADNHPDWILKIVGAGPQREELQKKVSEMNIWNQVEFSGEIPNEKIPDIYADSEIFVLPSKSEGLPRTILEALACETPVITSNLPQLESVVEGAGLTVNPESTIELSNALNELIGKDKKRRELGNCGRQKIVENYSWQDTVEKTVRVYRKSMTDSG